jgi:hypothetical protein
MWDIEIKPLLVVPVKLSNLRVDILELILLLLNSIFPLDRNFPLELSFVKRESELLRGLLSLSDFVEPFQAGIFLLLVRLVTALFSEGSIADGAICIAWIGILPLSLGLATAKPSDPQLYWHNALGIIRNDFL